jgi:PAS domain S-box-containing protein
VSFHELLSEADSVLQPRLFEGIASTTPDFVYAFDVNGRFLYANRRLLEVWGLPLPSVVGKTCRELGYESWHHDMHMREIAQVIETKRPIKGEVPFKAPRTGIYGVYEYIFTPVIGADGEVELIAGTTRDVTERKATEEKLRNSEARHAFLLQLGDLLRRESDAVVIQELAARSLGEYLKADRVHYAEAEQDNDEVFVISREYHRVDMPSAVGRHRFADFGVYVLNAFREGRTLVEFDVRERAEQAAAQLAAYAEKGIAAYVAVPLAKSGRVVACLGVHHRTPRHWTEHEVTLIEEVAERTWAAAGRARAEEALRTFANTLEQRVQERTEQLSRSEEQLRHLATELNLAEQRERQRLASELHDHLQQALVLGRLKTAQLKRLVEESNGGAAMAKQIDEVFSDALQYTRTLVSELSPPALRDHGLPAGLKSLAEYMKKHDLVVTVIVPDEILLKLPNDQIVLLFQSVRELLINAAKHSGAAEAVVTVSREETTLRIDVQDHGKGFDVTAPSPSSESSSKFGLFSIRERMKALGGSFEVNSTAGKGTTVSLTLPLRKDDSLSPPTPVQWLLSEVALPAAPARASGVIRVVLVDDHAMVRQGLKSLLQEYLDIELVGEASNGEEAVALVERLQPSAVIMDINMPKMNGIEATARIKSRYPETAIIGLSINAGEENCEAMKKAGATTLITKDAVVEELYAAIQDSIKKGERSCTIGPISSSRVGEVPLPGPCAD